MLDELLGTLSTAMTNSFAIALAASFAWGVLSILASPCHLASIPLVIGYIVKQHPGTAGRTIGLSTTFAVGILMSIALLGAITAALGRMMGDIGLWGNIIVATVFFFVGLYLMDVIRLSWNPMGGQPLQGHPWPGALALGLVFGLGLGPCTFAFLAPVLGLAFSLSGTDIVSAVLLIAAFGLGHCSVIAGAGSLTHAVQKYLRWTEQSKAAVYLRRVAGALVMLGGAYLLSITF